MEYTVSLYWKDVFIGDYHTVEEAENVMMGWIAECEDTDATDISQYRIVDYKE